MLNIVKAATQKHIAIFGGGRTGIEITLELAELGCFIDVYDKNSNLIFEIPNKFKKQIKLHSISNDSNLAKLQLQSQLNKNAITKYDSIFHTFLYTAEDFQNFITIAKGFSNHFGTIGTVLTIDRQSDTGILNENSPKIISDQININGGYAAGKRLLEIAIEKFTKSNPDKQFFIPKTLHIVGKGWVPGICSPNFRDNNLINTLENCNIWLPKGGDILYQMIDGKNLAEYIALGITKKLSGDFIIINDQIISASEYYNILADILGKKLEINNLEIESVPDTYMMLLDWVCNIKKLQEALERELAFIPHSETLAKSLITLQKIPERARGEPSEVWKKMNIEPLPESKKFRHQIQEARNLKIL